MRNNKNLDAKYLWGQGVFVQTLEYQPPTWRAYTSESGMDDLFLNRMLFEWLRDRWKEQAHAEIVSLKKFLNHANNPLLFQR